MKSKLRPSFRFVYNMDKDTLLKHYALVHYKASSLSSVQRDLVKYRIAYGINKELFTLEEVEKAITDLGLFVAKNITEKLNKSNKKEVNDNSSKK